MRPRFTLLAVLLILAVAYAVRGYLLWARWVPTDEVALTDAAWIRVHYYSSSNGMSSLEVREPDQVQEILGTLKIQATERRRYYYSSSGSGTVQVEFHFANGTPAIHTQFTDARHLMRSGWGQMTIDPAFYGKIARLIKQTDRQWYDPYSGTRMDSK